MSLVRRCALFLAALAAAGAWLSLGGSFSDGLDILAHLAPCWGAIALIALITGAAAGPPHGRATAALAAAALAACAILMGPELWAAARVGDAPGSGGETIKVIQHNLWSNNVDTAGTAAWLVAQKADVLVLEEVTAGALRTLPTLQAAYPWWTRCPPRTDCTTLIFARRAPSAQGILRSPDGDGRHSAAWATFGEGADAYTVFGTHNLWPMPPGPQQGQSRRYARFLARFDKRSLIIAGDFNSTPWSFSLARQDRAFGIPRRTRALFSFPSRFYGPLRLIPPLRLLPIDQIYAGPGWRTVRVEAGPRTGSDHLPIIAVLRRADR